jgi:hypothetical protein
MEVSKLRMSKKKTKRVKEMWMREGKIEISAMRSEETFSTLFVA